MRSDDIESREIPSRGGFRGFSLKEGSGPMSWLVVAVAVLGLINGCSHFRQQAADCGCGGQPCEGEFCDGSDGDGQYYDNGDCSDCLPPQVAGKYFYHKHIDKFVTTSTAQKCARRDLKFFDVTCDFKDGYQQAYIDLAVGRPACVPAIPPKKYWHAWHRSCAGRDAVDQWFAGYRNGLDNGQNSGVSRFNRIVGNPESCCVSAAYVSPYASSMQPSGVMPLDGQTISDASDDPAAAGNLAPSPADAPAQQPQTAPPSEAWPATYAGQVPVRQ